MREELFCGTRPAGFFCAAALPIKFFHALLPAAGFWAGGWTRTSISLHRCCPPVAVETSLSQERLMAHRPFQFINH